MISNRYGGGSGGPTGSIHRVGVSGGSLSGHSDNKWGDTTSKAGEVSRVFVGNIDVKTTNCNHIEQRFAKYGIIKGIDINPNGFAFVQFERINDAQNACQNENGTFVNNRKLEVRLFDKSNHPVKGRGGGHSGRDRSRSPLPRRPTGGPTGTRRGDVLPNANQYDDNYGFPPPPNEPIVGNDAEIIIVNEQQWGYADMIERRVRRETGIQYIDMLFLHSPSSLNLTLNDLFERRTLYAIVVSAVNEEHQSLTLHVLHNQTEHRNMPLEDAIQLIAKDFATFGSRNGRAPAPQSVPSQAIPSYSRDNPYKDNYSRIGGNDMSNEGMNRMDKSVKMPEEISFLLKTIIQEDGPQFLTLQQIDTLIEYLNRERNRLSARSQSFPASGSGASQQTDFDKQRATLLDNPHVQAALSSLLQIGALNNANKTESDAAQNNQSMGGHYGGQQMMNRDNNGVNNVQTRRHPLLGTELGSNKSIPGAPGGLVGYPLPQSYSQYGVKPNYN